MESVKTNRNKYYYLLVITILLNSEVFFLTGWKRSGIIYLREVFIILAAAFTAIYFISHFINRRPIKKVDLMVIFVAMLGLVSPSFHAMISYGQPIIYGILEERRILSYLAFFPIVFLIAKSKISSQGLEGVIYASGFAIIGLSFLYATGIIPENSRPSYMVEERTYGSNDPRYATRFPINTNYVFFVYCLAISKIISFGRTQIRAIIFSSAAIIYIVFVDQGRTNIGMFAFATLMAIAISRNKQKSFIISSAGGVLILGGTFWIGSDLISEKLSFFLAHSSTPIEDQVRYKTINTIMGNLYDSYFFGWGSLSLQWNEGFHRLYGQNFYLSDVALFGTLYRHGWVFPLFILAYLNLIVRSYKKVPDGYIKTGAFITLVSFLIFGFFNGKIEYAGSTICLIIAISAKIETLFHSRDKFYEKSTLRSSQLERMG